MLLTELNENVKDLVYELVQSSQQGKELTTGMLFIFHPTNIVRGSRGTPISMPVSSGVATIEATEAASWVKF